MYPSAKRYRSQRKVWVKADEGSITQSSVDECDRVSDTYLQRQWNYIMHRGI